MKGQENYDNSTPFTIDISDQQLEDLQKRIDSPDGRKRSALMTGLKVYSYKGASSRANEYDWQQRKHS